MEYRSGMPAGVPARRRSSLATAGASANWANDAERLGMGHEQDASSFFIPSYLRHSRYGDRLRAARRQRASENQELANQYPLGRHSAASSSSVHLRKPSAGSYGHRAMVQDVVERPSHSSLGEEAPTSLPSRLSERDKQAGLELSADGTEVRFAGVTKGSDEAASVRADLPMPKACGIYYFEITILSRPKDPSLIGIGFSSPKCNLARLPGWEPESWAYHGDDGHAFECHANGKQYGPKFGKEDVVGCGANFRTGNAFFTKNGIYLGVAFSGIKANNLYPSVGMKKPGEQLRINFGRYPFVFDIDKLVATERNQAFDSIAQADVSALQRPHDASSLLHHLVGQYLSHEGYVETAKAFAKDVNEAEEHLGNGRSYLLNSEEDDIHAVQRQRIRRSILDGDIDKALKYTSNYYPQVLASDQNRDIHFRLRCRKFIEMMKRYAELGDRASTPVTQNRSRRSERGTRRQNESEDEDDSSDVDSQQDDQSENEDDAPEHQDVQMEVDDQFQRETPYGHEVHSPDVEMETSQDLSQSISKLKAPDLLAASIAYGQELSQEFGGDLNPQNKKSLSDIFSIMAYKSIAESPVAHLFDVRGRTQIAEEVNSAILVSLGKSSDAALETVCAQTEVLLHETARKTGGAAAFVNVRRDFLQP